MTIQELAEKYYIQRGLDTSNWGRPTGKKMLEEAGELLEAIALAYHSKDVISIKDEVGDVAMTLAYIAQYNGFTVEQAMIDKAEKDKGRG